MPAAKKKPAARKKPAATKNAPAKKKAPPKKKPAAKKTAPAKAPAARETRYCRTCGAAGQCAPGGIPPGWSFSAEDGGITYMCDDCARRNIRSIEAKLGFEWWE